MSSPNPTSPIQNFGSGSGAAGLLKGRKHTLLFVQETSTAGSEWVRSASSELGLVQTFSDFFNVTLNDTLALAQTLAGVVDWAAIASNTLALVHGNTVAGGRVDGGGGGSGTPPVEAIFDSNSQAGFAVYVVSNGHVDNALADDFATSGVVGVCNGTVTAGNTGEYVTEGPIALEDWTAVTGSASLTPGAIYYLDRTTPGHLTSSAPEDGGECVVIVGRATDAATLDVEISPPIILSGNNEPDLEDSLYLAEFDSNAAVGNVLYVSGDGTVDLAQADAEVTSGVVGVAIESVTAAQSGHYTTDGPVERADWTTITGTEFLSPGALYYLSDTDAGQLTATPPGDVGESIVIVGRALTETVLDIEINPPLLLN